MFLYFLLFIYLTKLTFEHIQGCHMVRKSQEIRKSQEKLRKITKVRKSQVKMGGF